jgi:DnaK suppressor protein
MTQRPADGSALKGKKKKYYDALTEMRDRLIDEVQTLSAHSLSSNKQAGEELADVGSDNFIREMEIGLMSEEGRTIKLIQDAIGRLHDGSYGICSDCDEKIQAGRLEAIPYARLCINCKSRREKAEYFGEVTD